MNRPLVRSVTEADEASAVEAIVLAFAADPVARWTWPGAHTYLAAMPRFVRAFGGNAFVHGSAFCTDAGAALWLPPGVHPDEETMGEVMQSTVSESKRDEGSSLFEQMAKHHPDEPHWYLPLIGVDPPHQGKGHGDALLAHVLAQCDREERQPICNPPIRGTSRCTCATASSRSAPCRPGLRRRSRRCCAGHADSVAC